MEYQDHEVSGALSFFVDGTRSKLVGEAVKPKARVLDIGCGNGILLPYLPKDISYVGLDINQEILDWMGKKYPQHQFKFCRAGVDPLPQGPFDTVILAGFIEHIDLELHEPLLKSVAQVLAPEGKMILTTPTVVGGEVHKWLSKIHLVSAEAAHEHKGFLNSPTLDRLCEKSGIDVMAHHYYFLGMAHYLIGKKHHAGRVHLPH